MNRHGIYLGIFTLLGMACGFALAILLQPGNIPARAAAGPATGAGTQAGSLLAGSLPGSQPTPDASGIILAPGGQPTTTQQTQLPTNLAPYSPAAPAEQPAGRAFTYQGLLRHSGLPLSGPCAFKFGAWDSPSAGAQLGVTQTITSTVANGQFTVLLNDAGQFGGAAFDGRATWIATEVRCPSGSGSYTRLSPRQAITAAPLASGLVPHSSMSANDTFSGYAAMSIQAPAVSIGNPMGLMVSVADHSNYIGTFSAVGVWSDSGPGFGVWGSTNTGIGVRGSSAGNGYAGYFDGKVRVTGALEVPRFHVDKVINQVGPLPITSSSFSTSGGTLVLFYSGSGYASANNTTIGMNVNLDGGFVDRTGVFANQASMHLAFVSKQWVLTGIAGGTHTITLTAMPGTSSDFNDIYNLVVMELPY